MFCIYKIICLSTGKFYIGSTNNWQQRKSLHLLFLRRNNHHNQYLQRAWNKYTEKSFRFEIVEEIANENNLLSIEQKYLNKYWNTGRLFNLAKIAGAAMKGIYGKNHPMYGYKHTQEAKQKISQAVKQNNPMKYPEIKNKVMKQLNGENGYWYGKKFSKQHKENMSTGMQRFKHTFTVISPDGKTITSSGIKEFCNKHNLTYTLFYLMLKGKRNHHKGWRLY